MQKDLLLVIDMQNVYGEGGQWFCPHTTCATKNIKDLMEKRKESLDVIFTGFVAPEEPVGTWNKYNEAYSDVNEDPWSNDIMEAFAADVKNYPFYTKSTYSSLTIKEVREACLNAKQVVVTGVVAECCVLATVMALIDEGIKVIYLTDGVAGIDGETEKAVEMVLAGLAPLQVELMTTADYMKNTQ